MERIGPWERILCTFSERILRKSQGMRGRNELVGRQIRLVPRPYSEPRFYDRTGRRWTGSPPQSSRGEFSQRQGTCPRLLHPRQHGIHGQGHPKTTSHRPRPELPVPIWCQGFTPGSQGHTLPDPPTCAVTADALQGPRKGAHLPWALSSSPSEASEERPQLQGSELCTDLAFSARTPQKSPCTS